MACKLRIVSRILETFLDNPETGAHDCLLYLRELHDLPAIRQTFTVHQDGGFKSYFNTQKRSEIVESITAINNILFDFILNFAEMIVSRSFKWPVVQLTNSQRKEHIFVPEDKMKQKVEDKNRIKAMRKKWPNAEFNNSKGAYDFGPYVVNSAGRIYCKNFLRNEHHDEQDDEYLRVRNVIVDIGPNDDILYALEFLTDDRKNRTEYLRLKVFDLKRKSLRVIITKGLPPPENTNYNLWAMRVLQNKIVLCNEFGEVFVLTCSDTQDQLNQVCSFSLTSFSRADPQRLTMVRYMCVTNKREVIIARSDDKEVYICSITEEGQMEGIIRVPLEKQKHETESEVHGVAFDATHEEDIIVLRHTPHLDSRYQIEVYSRNGDTLGLYPLPGCWSARYSVYYLLSNPEGIVAVVEGGSRKIAFWNLVGKVFVQTERYSLK